MTRTVCDPAYIHGDATAALLPASVLTFLTAAADATRLRILVLLSRGERYAGDIADDLGLPANLVSHHLAVLARARLLTARREGRWMAYALAPESVDHQLHALLDLLAPGHAGRTARVLAEGSVV